MPMNTETAQPLHKRLWRWMRNQIVQEVPKEVGLCEFDCRKQECDEEEWANCERRVEDAAGASRSESPTANRATTVAGAAPSPTSAQSR